jgi:tRNA 2-thiouridine synthesizing protein C
MLDDGVLHLKKNQQPDRLGMKDTAAIFEALALYDVNELYVEDESLAERGLQLSDLGLSVKHISRSAVAEFMKRFDVLVAG